MKHFLPTFTAAKNRSENSLKSITIVDDFSCLFEMFYRRHRPEVFRIYSNGFISFLLHSIKMLREKKKEGKGGRGAAGPPLAPDERNETC